MGTTVESMIKAGAIESICLYHHNIGADIDDWHATEEFAKREFRMVDSLVIAELVFAARIARMRGLQCQSATR